MEVDYGMELGYVELTLDKLSVSQSSDRISRDSSSCSFMIGSGLSGDRVDMHFIDSCLYSGRIMCISMVIGGCQLHGKIFLKVKFSSLK